MAEKKNPTNLDILKELQVMGQRISALEQWKIADDAAKAAVREYRREEERGIRDGLQNRQAKTWTEVGKQLAVVLGIIATILYAIAATRGIK